MLTNGSSSQRLALERRLPRLPRLEPHARRAADAPHHRRRRSTRHPSRSRDRCWRGERLWAGRGGDEAARGEGWDQARAVLDRAHRCAPFCLLDLLVLEKRVLRGNPSRAGCIAALWPVGARVVRDQHESVQLGLAAVLGASSYSLPLLCPLSIVQLTRAVRSSPAAVVEGVLIHRCVAPLSAFCPALVAGTDAREAPRLTQWLELPRCRAARRDRPPAHVARRL